MLNLNMYQNLEDLLKHRLQDPNSKEADSVGPGPALRILILNIVSSDTDSAVWGLILRTIGLGSILR